MAIGAYPGKGSNGGGQRERGRRYVVMLLLAFIAALLGVMALHKLRDRRIQNLLLRDKDREIFSLHLLLQKERDRGKEMAKQVEEMKAKMYSIRTRKMELDSRVIEMQSTISSMEDEQRTIKLALEERQSEIKLLREKEREMSKRDIEQSSLKEILKQKEIEIADLKRQLESASLSSTESRRKEEINKLQARGQSHGESSENSTLDGGVEEAKRKVNVLEGKMLAEEDKLKVHGNNTDIPAGGEPVENNNFMAPGINTDGSAASQYEQNSVEKGGRNGLTETNTANTTREASEVVEGKAELKKEGEKLEQPGATSSHSGSSIQRMISDGKGSRSRGKRWKALVRNRRLESNKNLATMKHHRFIEDAIEIKEGKQSGDNVVNGQGHYTGTKKMDEYQMSSTVMISQDFSGGNQEMKEDGHGYESQGNGEESIKEEMKHEPMTTSDQRDKLNGEVSKNGILEIKPKISMSGDENRALEEEIREIGSQDEDTARENFNKETDGGETGHADDIEEEVKREADIRDSLELEKERAGGNFKGSTAKVEEAEDEYNNKEVTDES
ncbi:hypothetical protein SAY86_022550 [Trapa natans]|uniref:Micronuclear linker histone polyprotein-like protein n=1 Tax=Trapa natans TaxID=22666 RepID=A0AAN7M9A2_TRANT|nr:hypothetical protein SAY86_022550 [Trapa natans]